MPERVVDPDGLAKTVHCVPPSVVAMTPDPTAMQSILEVQSMALSTATPFGAVSNTHVVPPSLVRKMVTPKLPEDEATATHTSTLVHEIPVKPPAISGVLSRDQVLPPLLVLMMLGLPLKISLTAWHVDEVVHEIPVSEPTPGGVLSVTQCWPPSVVRIMIGPAKLPNPTAKQSTTDGHEIPVRPLTSEGTGREVQENPWFVDARIESTPTAKQSSEDGHETELIWFVPWGGVWELQEDPEFVVVMIVDPAPRLPLSPTATQSIEFEQEIASRSTALGGATCDDQFDPLLLVEIT